MKYLASMLLCVGLSMASQGVHASGADYPERPITIVVGFAPGGFSDTLVRQFAVPLGERLGQHIVISNKPGAGTTIATSEVARAKPDGYTLLLGTSSLSIYPTLQPMATPKEPMRELAPISMVHESPFVLLVNKDVPANTLREFIAYAKDRPDQLNVGSSGIGAVNHLLIEMFNSHAGLNLAHIPYKGGAPVMLDMHAKRLDATFATPLDALPYAKEGHGKILAVTSKERLSVLPEVPAMGEILPGFEGVFWTGLFAPAGTPEPILKKLEAAVRETSANPQIIERTGDLIVTLRPEGAEKLFEYLDRETKEYSEIIRNADIQPQ